MNLDGIWQPIKGYKRPGYKPTRFMGVALKSAIYPSKHRVPGTAYLGRDLMAKKVGRKKGSRRKGYHYRKGRGWYARDEPSVYHLSTQTGNYKDRSADPEAVKEAFERWKVAAEAAKAAAEAAERAESIVTLEKVCDLYLSYVEMTGAAATNSRTSTTATPHRMTTARKTPCGPHRQRKPAPGWC